MTYIDDYSACSRTYATLRLYPNGISPSAITKKLKIEPSRTSLKGGGLRGKYVDGWFLSTQDVVDSRDTRRHIDWLLDKIEPVGDKIIELQKAGVKMDICCFWGSVSGNGGPTISPKQMNRLVNFNLEVWWDVWFDGSK